ncbi:YybH family protein [Bacillus sp. SD088]|uniref:YybH family protein n=1 Tax=Bacillus sp. SD088 TaxID=2782012 RepID=UPI001A969FCD|nr:nuclear transport factor 2 family protein [Bacillus sp. SD088]MBO0994637.1 nuclear transport factor 2 family protein [Bacillus sp. SD088]
MDFNQTLERHMQAMVQKDIVGFSDTIHQNNIILILPNGKFIQNREEFIQFNQDWFSDTDWKITYDIVKSQESKEMAFVVLLIHYDDCDEEGTPYHQDYYLHLVFEKENDEWLLTYDQNTFIN